MVPFGPCPTVPAGQGIAAAWLEPGDRASPATCRARLEADRRLDGHDRRLRSRRAAARPASDDRDRQLPRGRARDQGAGRGPPRALERAALRRRQRRREGVQARPLVAAQEPRGSHRPPGRDPRRAPGRGREGPPRLGEEGDGPCDLQARPDRRQPSSSCSTGCSPASPAAVWNRSSASAARSANTARASSPPAA